MHSCDKAQVKMKTHQKYYIKFPAGCVYKVHMEHKQMCLYLGSISKIFHYIYASSPKSEKIKIKFETLLLPSSLSKFYPTPIATKICLVWCTECFVCLFYWFVFLLVVDIRKLEYFITKPRLILHLLKVTWSPPWSLHWHRALISHSLQAHSPAQG